MGRDAKNSLPPQKHIVSVIDSSTICRKRSVDGGYRETCGKLRTAAQLHKQKLMAANLACPIKREAVPKDPGGVPKCCGGVLKNPGDVLKKSEHVPGKSEHVLEKSEHVLKKAGHVLKNQNLFWKNQNLF